jgi:hypothetical protein
MQKVQTVGLQLDCVVFPYELIVDNMLKDIEEGIATNMNGENYSEYYTLVQLSDSDKKASVNTTLCEEESNPENKYYSVHLVDDITGGFCETYYTDTPTREELVDVLRDLINTITKEVIKQKNKIEVVKMDNQDEGLYLLKVAYHAFNEVPRHRVTFNSEFQDTDVIASTIQRYLNRFDEGWDKDD